MALEVQATPDLRRILALPRRSWPEQEAEALAEAMTQELRTAAGAMRLRPVQAIALAELASHGGLFAPMRVGAGKTLLSLLAPEVLNAKRPLLLLPAKLVAKTEREQRRLMEHWMIPNYIRIVSYEMLGRVQSAELLDRYKPDLVIADEAHRLKNPRAAVTRRVARYLAAHRDVKVVAMSGTVMRRGLEEFARILGRCVGFENAPVPLSDPELEEWGNALDEKPGAETRFGVGALTLLCNAQEQAMEDKLQACRLAFRRRLVDTPGVVATTEGFEGASLSIMSVSPDMGPRVREAIATLHRAWVMPDDHPLADGIEVWRHARELALGFYYYWDPPAPKFWLEPRKVWCATCRAILQNNRRHLDSELQVVRAVDAGHYHDAEDELEAWRRVKDTFEPNTVPMWIDDSAITFAAEWMDRGPGIVWCEHRAFAERLGQVSGRDYYGRQGRNARGGMIEDADPRVPLIASVASNSEGRNLQAWNRNLVVSPPASGAAWEQLLGRCHRDGQEADEVTFEVFQTCAEHTDAMAQAFADARCIEAMQGQAQKLVYADTDIDR